MKKSCWNTSLCFYLEFTLTPSRSQWRWPEKQKQSNSDTVQTTRTYCLKSTQIPGMDFQKTTHLQEKGKWLHPSRVNTAAHKNRWKVFIRLWCTPQIRKGKTNCWKEDRYVSFICANLRIHSLFLLNKGVESDGQSSDIWLSIISEVVILHTDQKWRNRTRMNFNTFRIGKFFFFLIEVNKEH